VTVAGASFESHDGEPAWPPRAQANYALVLLIVAFAFSFLDRVILSMVMVPIQKEMAFSDVQLALLHGFAFVVLYVVAGFPLGRMADRRSRRGLVAAGIFVWSLCTAACGLARNFTGLFLARVGVGIGEAALSPAAFSMIADYFRPERRARAIATYQLGVIAGSGIAYILGGLVIGFATKGQHVDVPLLGALSPWRVTFLAVGLPGLLIALLMLTIVEPVRRGASEKARADGASLIAWVRANRRTVSCFAFGYSLINVSFNAIIAWGPTWLARVHHLTPPKIGLLLGASMLLAGGIGQLLGAARSDRRFALGDRAAVFNTGILCATILVPVSLAVVAPMLAVAMVMVAAIVFFACAAIGHAPSLIGQIAPNRLRGQVAAIFLLAMNLIGTGVGPLAVALLTEKVFRDPAMVGVSIAITAAAGAALGGVLLYLGRAALVRSVDAQINQGAA
jgi:MFS family permease